MASPHCRKLIARQSRAGSQSKKVQPSAEKYSAAASGIRPTPMPGRFHMSIRTLSTIFPGNIPVIHILSASLSNHPHVLYPPEFNPAGDVRMGTNSVHCLSSCFLIMAAMPYIYDLRMNEAAIICGATPARAFFDGRSAEPACGYRHSICRFFEDFEYLAIHQEGHFPRRQWLLAFR